MEVRHIVGTDCSVDQLSAEFLRRNYDYVWLSTMLRKAEISATPGSTLITGSSHALNGIYEPFWKNAVNCSMHSQDLYYDFCCARKVLEKNQNFNKCFIVMGYYIAYQDLSRSMGWGKTIISSVYKPIFDDSHNWPNFPYVDPWAEFGDLSSLRKEQCEQLLYGALNEQSYYNAIRSRTPFFDFQGYEWQQLSETQHEQFGKIRAESHNKSFRYTSSFEENKLILRQYVHYLYQHEVLPILVVTPFTPAYNRYVLQDMKDGLLEMVDSVPENVHYVDFNDALELFTPTDFMDTDHLSEQGAKKVSGFLTEMFGT